MRPYLKGQTFCELVLEPIAFRYNERLGVIFVASKTDAAGAGRDPYRCDQRSWKQTSPQSRLSIDSRL
jgi:hypothetical protein